ncbi:BON domain-containing protein [Moraxella sp. ZY200743]|uniref:BON domain-containing protein n=1 Tax=Moraxella sp. ZY200743 TaxID=2911970 RepID=UPI003D7EB8A2
MQTFIQHTPKMAMLILAAALNLTACSTLGGGDAFGVYEMGRSIPERISDESIELMARKNLARISGVNENTVRIAFDSFRKEVLITGEVPSQAIKDDIEAMVKSMRDVAEVYNYLTISSTPKSQSHTLHEGYLKSKINARLLTNQGIKSSQYKIVVRDQTAYVMGHMSPEQQDHILAAIQNTAGMALAVTLTTLINDDMPATLTSTQDITADNSVVYGGVVSTEPTNEPYLLQEIYVPNASTDAPTNIAPAYTPKSGTSGYVQLHQGTNNP